MPVFLQFRLWLAQGSVAERALAAGGAALAVLLLALASLPLTDDGGGSDLVTAGTTSDGGLGAAQTSSAAGAMDGEPVLDGGATAPSSGDAIVDPAAPDGEAAAQDDHGAGVDGGAAGGGPTAASGPDCSPLGESAPGISESEVVIGAALVNLAGPVGNSAFDIRPDMEEIVAAVTEHINANGGVACGRKLVVRTYDVNPIDANDQQAKCLQMVQDGVFSVVDMAGYARPVGRTCFVQNKIPHQISTSSTQVDLEKGYPYLYGLNAFSEKQVRDGILGLHELGFFAAPAFEKLGLLVDSCDPTVESAIDASLRKIGIGPGKVSKFKMNCQLVAPPNEVLQGVVKHKSDGATHVFLAGSLSNSGRYTQLAAQQGFRPKYGMSDYGTLTSANATWDPSAAGALAITSTRRAELNSGIRNDKVEECHAILVAAGLRGIEREREDGTAGSICDALLFWKAAIDRAGSNPTRLSLIETGLPAIGEHRSGMSSDGIFDRRGKVTGGDYYRPLQLDGGCVCWKIRDPNFKRGF